MTNSSFVVFSSCHLYHFWFQSQKTLIVFLLSRISGVNWQLWDWVETTSHWISPLIRIADPIAKQGKGLCLKRGNFVKTLTRIDHNPRHAMRHQNCHALKRKTCLSLLCFVHNAFKLLIATYLHQGNTCWKFSDTENIKPLHLLPSSTQARKDTRTFGGYFLRQKETAKNVQKPVQWSPRNSNRVFVSISFRKCLELCMSRALWRENRRLVKW